MFHSMHPAFEHTPVNVMETVLKLLGTDVFESITYGLETGGPKILPST